MCEFSDAWQLYPDQWKRLIQGGGKQIAWGEPELTHSLLSGKTVEEMSTWQANLKIKIPGYLARVPMENEVTDGFWEVKLCWLNRRIRSLSEAKTRLLEMNSVPEKTEEEKGYTRLPSLPHQPSAIRPLIPTPGGWPGARSVSYTKMSALSTENINGDGLLGKNDENASLPSPSALLEDACRVQPWPNLDAVMMRKPFKTPRKREEPEKEQEKEPEMVRRSKRLKKKNNLYCDEEILTDTEI